MIRPIALALTLAGIALATDANAQHVLRRSPTPPVATTRMGLAPPTQGPSASSPTARSYSYSYYTLSPLPARTYVGYGSQDFPFHGVPYGHPYDPWTWPMMSGSYSNGMARYYDPPVK